MYTYSKFSGVISDDKDIIACEIDNAHSGDCVALVLAANKWLEIEQAAPTSSESDGEIDRLKNELAATESLLSELVLAASILLEEAAKRREQEYASIADFLKTVASFSSKAQMTK